MEISLRLSNLSDAELRFIRQLGVERVDIHNPLLVPGYETQGDIYLTNVSKVIRKVRDSNLDVASFWFPKIREALMGRPGWEREIDDLCLLIEALGHNEVKVIQIDTHSVRKSPLGVPGHFAKGQRAGYMMDAFTLERMREKLLRRDLKSPWAHHFTDSLTAEEYFENCVRIYERIIPVLEEAGVKLAIHTDDPPVPDEEGLLPGITTLQQIQRLLDAVPSPNSGLLFCTGTRYESGIDIFDQIEMFGHRIFHVHFRNVRGTLPSTSGYEEVALDEGDMDMLEVLRALDRVGYDGALNPDHVPKLTGDTSDRNAARAFAVGYIRALLSTL